MKQTTMDATQDLAPVLDALLARMAGGDREAFREFYERVRAPLYAFAMSVLQHPQDAEDALQECCLRAFAAAGRYRPDGKPLAWLFTIARNFCRTRQRAGNREIGLPDEEWEQFLASRPDVDAGDRLLLSTVLRFLGETERQIVLLHAVAGFRHREIASLLELPLSTVLSKYQRSLKKLRLLLGEDQT